MPDFFRGSYNPVVQNSAFNVNTTYMARPNGFEILTQAVAANAFHNSDDRPDPPKCHENTRVAVINKIMDWVTGRIDTAAFILWLYGPAGAGKSAIARTVAQLCESWNLLLASFLFFRTDSRRNTMAPLVATLAYQISLAIPAVRPHIEAVVEAHPLILSYSRERLEEQFIKLVFEPLRLLSEQGYFSRSPLPPLIIIDGLDECLDEGAQTTLVRRLFSLTYRYQLPLKFLIASRVGPHIKAAFSSDLPLSHLELNNDFHPDVDIRHFLEDKFREIRTTHQFRSRIPSDWPDKGTLYTLVRKASGQFMYASLAARFVDSPRHLPTQRLEILLDIRPPTNRDLPFAELDNLYTWLLSRVEDPPLVLQILGFHFALKQSYPRTKVDTIEWILSLEGGQLSIALTDLGSILHCDSEVMFHHRSFIDFLLNPQRSKEYYIDVCKSHTAIAQRILQTFSRSNVALPDPQIMTAICEIQLHKHLEKSYASAELEYDLKEFSFGVYSHSTFNSFWADEMSEFDWQIWLSFAFLQYLKRNNNNNLYHQHSEDFRNYLVSWFESRPCQDRFHLLSTVWFICHQSPSSPLDHLLILHHKPFRHLWKKLCASLFHCNPSDLNWEDDYYRLLHCRWHKEGGSGLAIIDLLHGGHAAFMHQLAPDHILPDRLAHVAIACIRHLDCRQTLHRLTVFARKSRRSPWLWRRRMLAASLFVYFVQGFMDFPERKQKQCQSLYEVHHNLYFKRHHRPPDAMYAMHRWTLEILHRALRKGGKSDELTNILSKPIELWLPSVFFPRHVRRIKRAIATYMDKYGPRPKRTRGQHYRLEG